MPPPEAHVVDPPPATAPVPIVSHTGLRARALDGIGVLDTPPDDRFDRITRLARSVFGVSVAKISLLDGERFWVKSADGSTLSEYPAAESFCEAAVNVGDALVVEDATRDSRFSSGPWINGEQRIRFYAGIPLRDGHDIVIGTFCLSDEDPREFSDGQLDVLTELAKFARDELLASDESRRAREVQQGMLPRGVPAAGGYRLSGTCVPMTAVGGDLYDWTELPQGIGVSLLDVMGKGTGAAIMSASVRSAVRAATRRSVLAAEDDVLSVGRIMASVAQTLQPDLDQTATMVTLFLGYVSTSEDVLRWSDAGHGLAVVVDAEGKGDWLKGGGLPLGVSASVLVEDGWATMSRHLDPGDTVLIFSDGLLDLFGGDHAAMGRVVELVAANRDPADLTARISELARRFVATDDVTAVAIGRPRE